MYALLQDIRFSLRLMRKRPGSTFLVIAALTLGIGLNAGIFSVVNAILLRPLPIREPDRVVWVTSKVNSTGALMGTSYVDYLDWRAQSRSFEAIAAIYGANGANFTLTGSGSPESVKASGFSASMFKAWGVDVMLGRSFTEEDDKRGAELVTVLSYHFWQRKFGGDPAVLGKPLILDDKRYAIIGVVQPVQIPTFVYPDLFVANGPLLDSDLLERQNRQFFSFARLKPGITVAQAQAEMDAITARLVAQYPATNKDMGAHVAGVAEQAGADGRKPILLLSLASGLILLLAAVNVATVFLGHAAERGRELGVRLALGATRISLLRQLLVQSAMFAILGGAFGLIVAKLGLLYFLRRFPDVARRFRETTMDHRVFAVTIGITALVSLIGCLPPAIYAFKIKIGAEMKGEGGWFVRPRYRNVWRGVLITFEVALASGLSLVSGLLVKSLYNVEKVDLGFNPERIVSFRVDLPESRYKDQARKSAFYDLAATKLRGLPGMESTAATSGLPLTSQGWLSYIRMDGQSPLHGENMFVDNAAVSTGYFRTMRIPLMQGRDFTDADSGTAPPVVIVDNLLAAKLWPGKNPVGQRIQMTGYRDNNWRWREVVGVVGEIKHFTGLEGAVRWMQTYVPQRQDAPATVSFVVSATLPETTIRTQAEKAIHELDGDLPVQNFETLNEYRNVFLKGRKAGLLLLGGLALIGIVLGMIGIYGVAANAVTQRKREISIRLAVGATYPRTMLLVTRLGFIATLAGIVIGSAMVISLTRLLSSFLFGVSALDPATYAVSAASLLALATVAGLTPAARMMRFNIQEILRQ
jgi:putative ABC transport system permease protein